MHNRNRITLQIRVNLLVSIALVLASLIAIAPIGITVLTSLKNQADITRKPPLVFPCDTLDKSFDITACRWSIEGYERVMVPQPSESAILGFTLNGKMLRTYIPNTMRYASGTAVLVCLLSSLSGYGFSRFKFRGHRVLLTMIYGITGVPLLSNLIAIYQVGSILRKGFPFFDDRIFLIFVYLGFFLPISVWIMKGFFDTIPVELEETALIEGCTPFGALFRITLPLAMPGVVSVFLLTFVSVWNEFIVAYLLVPEDNFKPAIYGLYDFLSQNIVNLQVLAAACIIIAMPIVVLVIFTRRVFFTAMVEGAVKG